MASASSLARNTATAILEDLLEAEQHQRRRLEGEVRELRKALNELAEGVAPDVAEAAIRRGHDPLQWTAAEWRTALPEMIKNAMRHFGTMADDRLGYQAQELAHEQMRVADLAAQLQALQQEQQQVLQANAAQSAQLREALRDNEKLRATLTAQQHHNQPPSAEPAPPAAPADTISPATTPASSRDSAKGYPELPASFDEAAAISQLTPRYYQRDMKLLFLIGKTGRSRRPWLLDGLAHYEHLKSGKAGSIRSALNRLINLGLIEETKLRNNNLANIIRLTAQGKAVYTAIFGTDPTTAEVERLLEGHQPYGMEHAGLALAVAQFLEELGWDVMIAPPPITLPGGQRLEPDLLLQLTEVRYYAEVERARGPATNREAKWRNLLKFQGAVYVLTSDPQKSQQLVELYFPLN